MFGYKKKPLPAPSPPPKKRKSFPFILLLVTSFSVWLLWTSLHPTLPAPGETPRLYSNQLRQDLHLTLLRALQKADHSIYLVMFGLSDPTLLSTLSKKISQHVPTTIYYDPIGSPDIRKTLSGSQIHPIRDAGFMHQKLLILNDEMVFLGSANFTTASLKMHDNLVLGFNSQKTARFLKEHAPLSPGHLRTMVGGQELEIWLLPDPRGHALTELRKKIRSATRSVRCALFTFTHQGLAEELIRAKRRGLHVSVVIDLYSSLGASAPTVQLLKKAGIPIFVSQGQSLLHHKFALLDDQTLLLGSANWTKAAFTKNHDCLLLLYNLTSEQKTLTTRLWNRLQSEAKKST